MQTAFKNSNSVSRDQNQNQNYTVPSYSLSAEEKLSIMEALDHLYVTRQYQEMGACVVCKKISVKKCSGCGIFYCSNECQTFDWPKHRVHCSKQRDSLSERNSFASSRTMRGTSVKNLSEETLMMNDRTSPFTALANQLSRKSSNLFSGNKGMTNLKIGNKRYKNREQTSKNNETENTGVQQFKKFNPNDRKKNSSSPKKSINKKSSFTEDKRDITLKKNSSKNNLQNLVCEKQKSVENIPNEKSTLDCKKLPKLAKMEVVCTFRESPNRYWVMEAKNLEKYEEIQATLKTECANYETTFAKQGFVYGCTYADEWFRAKVTSLAPETVHFIDYGDSSNYDIKVFKKLPSELRSIPALAFLIEFEDGTPTQYKVSNLDSLKLTIEETSKASDGVPCVKILDGAYGPTLHLQPVRNPEKSKKKKSVMDFLTTKSNGMLFFMPGDGTTRFASIVPDNHKEASECLEKVLSIDNPDSSSFDAVEGNYVLVTDREGNDQRGRVTCKVGTTYYVQLIDCGNVISADKVYPLPDDLKELIELGVKVTLEEVTSPEEMEQLETCFFTINGEQTLGKWPCVLEGPEQQIIAKAWLEKPIEVEKWQPEYVFLKSGSTVEISFINSPDSIYVRSVDAETEQKCLDMNMEMVQFAPKAESYTVPPSIGELCCAKFKDDGCFYRAVVNSVEKGKIYVLFVDFGNQQATDLRDVKPLPDSLKNFPFFAVKINLKNVSNKLWNNMIKEYMAKLTSENIELTMTYEKSMNNGVILQEKVSGVVVNDFIEKAKDKDRAKATIEDFKKEDSFEKKEIFLDDDLKYTTIKPGSECVLAILYISEEEFETSYTFWATIAGTDNFNFVNGKLSSLISDYCATDTTPYKPSFRELCLAEYEGYWYRAACAKSEGDLYKVFFVDFGNVCELRSSSIRKMNKEFLKAPALAMNCTIKDSERLKGSPELTKNVFETLQNRMNSLINGVTVTEAKEDIFLLEIPEIEAMLSN